MLLNPVSPVIGKLVWFGWERDRWPSSSFADEKLLLWAKGAVLDAATTDWTDPDADWADPDADWGLYRIDVNKTNGDFPVKIVPNGDTVTSAWDTVNATYHLPEEAALVAADALEGPFFFDGSGDTVGRTLSEIESYVSGKASVFFCTGRGLKLYNEILAGSELSAAQNDCA